MKNKKITYLFLLLALAITALSCKRPAPKPQSTVDLKTAKTLLQGSWFDKNSDNAEFFIQGDSLGDVDALQKTKYILKGDTLDLITNKPYVKQILLKLSKDSLIVQNLPDMSVSRYWHNH